MEQSPSLKANRFSASREIPGILWNSECSLPHSQVPATCSVYKVSVQFRGFQCELFVTGYVFTARSCFHLAHHHKLEHHPLSAVRDCLFNVLSASLNIGGLSSIRSRRTRYAPW